MTGDTVVRLAGAMEAHPQVGLIQTFPGDRQRPRHCSSSLQQFAGPGLRPADRAWHCLVARAATAITGAITRRSAPKPLRPWPVCRISPAASRSGGHNSQSRFRRGRADPPWRLRRPHRADTVGQLRGDPALVDRIMPFGTGAGVKGTCSTSGVLPARGLHWMSRLHLLTGIGSYITAPLWLMFLIAGILISLQAQFIRPEYFPQGFSLFPQWPAQDPVRAALVFATTMGPARPAEAARLYRPAGPTGRPAWLRRRGARLRWSPDRNAGLGPDRAGDDGDAVHRRDRNPGRQGFRLAGSAARRRHAAVRRPRSPLSRPHDRGYSPGGSRLGGFVVVVPVDDAGDRRPGAGDSVRPPSPPIRHSGGFYGGSGC